MNLALVRKAIIFAAAACVFFALLDGAARRTEQAHESLGLQFSHCVHAYAWGTHDLVRCLGPNGGKP